MHIFVRGIDSGSGWISVQEGDRRVWLYTGVAGELDGGRRSASGLWKWKRVREDE